MLCKLARGCVYFLWFTKKMALHLHNSAGFVGIIQRQMDFLVEKFLLVEREELSASEIRYSIAMILTWFFPPVGPRRRSFLETIDRNRCIMMASVLSGNENCLINGLTGGAVLPDLDSKSHRGDLIHFSRRWLTSVNLAMCALRGSAARIRAPHLCSFPSLIRTPLKMNGRLSADCSSPRRCDSKSSTLTWIFPIQIYANDVELTAA